MIRIIEGRDTGKTKRLLAAAAENNAIFVCNNPDGMKYKARSYGFDNIKIVSYGEYLEGLANTYTRQPVMIDELEKFLKAIMQDELIGYTISIE